MPLHDDLVASKGQAREVDAAVLDPGPALEAAAADGIVGLRARGGDVDTLIFPDEGHGFVKPENRLDFFRRAERFLAKHLGGRAEAA